MLRRRVGQADWWVLANSVGGVVSWVGSGAIAWGAAYAVGGAVAGAGQWLVLRRRISQAGWWVLVSAVGYTVAWNMAQAMTWSVAGFGVVFGIVYAVITGPVLLWLFKQPRESER